MAEIRQADASLCDSSQEIIYHGKRNEIFRGPEDVGTGRLLEMPHVFGDGKTVNQCIENTGEALTAAVAHLLEEGQRPPTPATEGRRTMQVNVRLTAEEKALLEVTAKRKGFTSLSDFVRAAAVEVAK